ncbi:MAG: Zn-ribbon domain-containing OB-fold protein [Candidatus Bathyarchaeia archaeon]
MPEKSGFPTLRSIRSLTLRYNIPITKTAKFWDGLKKGKILTTKCRRCGHLYFPPTADCPSCLSSDMEWVALSGDAELETFTQVAIKPSSFNQFEPYIVAVGKLREGVRVLAWLTGVELGDAKVGMKLRLVTKMREGRPTYEFIPAPRE